MTPDRDISLLQKKIDYYFKNISLLEQALTHRSYAVEHSTLKEDNERLEFLGDAVLELVMSRILFDEYGKSYSEGDMTRMRAFLVSEAQLARQAQKIGIGIFVRLGRGEEKNGGRGKKSILADTFEAIMGAIYLDGGIEPCFSFIKRLYGKLLTDVHIYFRINDYKTTLQELTQAKFHTIPVYEVKRVLGPQHSPEFEVALIFNDEILTYGKGTSKKRAEQDAARRALEILGSASIQL